MAKTSMKLSNQVLPNNVLLESASSTGTKRPTVTHSYNAADQGHWSLERWQEEYRILQAIQQLALDKIESLQRHEADITQMVTWLHSHAPERFDQSGTKSMGDVVIGILQEWVKLRDENKELKGRLDIEFHQWSGRTLAGRLKFILTGK